MGSGIGPLIVGRLVRYFKIGIVLRAMEALDFTRQTDTERERKAHTSEFRASDRGNSARAGCRKSAMEWRDKLTRKCRRKKEK